MGDKKPKNCLVTGATGVIGVPLVEELIKEGHRVTILARDASKTDFFPDSVKIVRGDLSDRKSLEKASDEAEWIFHLAAKLHISNPSPELRGEYLETNVEGTRRLLEIAARNRTEKFVFFSTINVYGASRRPEIFDETSPLNPIGFYGESKVLAENLVKEAKNSEGKKIGVCLRPAAVYGSRMKGNYLQLARAIKRGRFFFIGDAQNRRTLIHQKDAARAAVTAAEKADGGSVYNVTDGEIHSFREIVEEISRAAGVRPPRLQMPVAPFRIGFDALHLLEKFTGLKFPFNKAMLEKLLEDIAVSGEKIQKELGFRPQFDLRKGWLETFEISRES